MDNCEFILLIMNCHKYRDKAIQQKNGWLKNIPNNITYFHVIGDKNMCDSNKFLFNYDENILYVNTNDVISKLGISSGDNVTFHIKAKSSIANSKPSL